MRGREMRAQNGSPATLVLDLGVTFVRISLLPFLRLPRLATWAVSK